MKVIRARNTFPPDVKSHRIIEQLIMNSMIKPFKKTRDKIKSNQVNSGCFLKTGYLWENPATKEIIKSIK